LAHYFLEDELVDALIWLYPNGYIADEMINKCILASTNEVVDKWNSIVQQLKPLREEQTGILLINDPFITLVLCQL